MHTILTHSGQILGFKTSILVCNQIFCDGEDAHRALPTSQIISKMIGYNYTSIYSIQQGKSFKP